MSLPVPELTMPHNGPNSTILRTRDRAIGVFSSRLAGLRDLPAFLGGESIVLRPKASQAKTLGCVVGWGEKPNTGTARRYARKHNLPYLRLEDGFLRSVGLGKSGEPPLSIVVDDLGIYYDATAPSRLESWLNDVDSTPRLRDPALLVRARQAISSILEHRLSKYNNSSVLPPSLPHGRPRVLVVDQTAGDLSVSRGLVPPGGFADMLETALSEHPNAQIIVKTHPDVLAGKRAGFLSPEQHRDQRIHWLASHVNPLALLEQVDQVYVATSQLGFEALLLRRPVTCFGAPFYAGWGLTDDRRPIPRRNAQRSLEELFAAAYLLYPRYVDPETGSACEAERVIEHLALQRDHFAKLRGRVFCFGFQLYKRGYARRYLSSPDAQVFFPRSARHAIRLGADKNATMVVWGQRDTRDLRRLAARTGSPLWRMEDAFLRSVGLGSDLVAPASLVIDRTGLYYDPTQPSDLETILQQTKFSENDLTRARALRTRMVRSGLTKYNLQGEGKLPRLPHDRAILLVPGQVEDDASVKMGGGSIHGNVGLLRAVRSARPDAFILYKPHPDVVSGNRQGRISERQAKAFCDAVVATASIEACINAADEVHTLTSQTGFEALLRDTPVTTYGQPFYAGWGLTQDHTPVPRRQRNLTIDELVAGVLLYYPRYLHPRTGQFTTPESIANQLDTARTQASYPSLRMHWLRRQLFRLLRAYRGLPHAR